MIVLVGTVEDVSALVEAISGLLGVVIWPAVVLFVLWRFRNQVGEVGSAVGGAIREGRGVRAGPVEITPVVQATELIASAQARQGGGPDGTAQPVAPHVERLAEAVRQQPEDRPIVLWVDDQPKNNMREAKALRLLGIDVSYALSTDEAISVLAQVPFDLVITDLGRPDDRAAGYTLIRRMRELEFAPPVIVYSSRADGRDRAEASARGAVARVNSPSELIQEVTRVLTRQQSRRRRFASSPH